MDTINYLVESATNLASELLINIAIYAVLGAILGLVTGIILVKRIRRYRIFQRPNKIWSFLVKLNYILIPLSLFLVGLTQGGIWGAHTTAEGWIYSTTDPLIEYAEQFLPDIQNFVNQNILDLENTNIDDVMFKYNRSMPSNNLILTKINTFLLSGFLDILPGISGDYAEPIVIFSQIDINHLDRTIFELVPASMRSVCSYYFSIVYWYFFTPFGFYFLIVIIEILISRKALDMRTSGSQLDFV